MNGTVVDGSWKECVVAASGLGSSTLRVLYTRRPPLDIAALVDHFNTQSAATTLPMRTHQQTRKCPVPRREDHERYDVVEGGWKKRENERLCGR
jgi:hypothetical protein